MKRKSKLTAGIIVMLGVAGIFIMSACKELSEKDDLGIDNTVSFEEIGILHNELLSNYYGNRVHRNTTLDEKISELMDMSWDHLAESGFSRIQLDEAKRTLPEFPGKSDLKGISEDGFLLDTAQVLGLLSQNANLSAEFIADLSELVLKAYSGEDAYELKVLLNEEFALNSYADEEDEIAKEVFVDLFNSSFTYWEEFYSSKKSALKLKDSSKVIINDAIGGVIGTIFGPIGSVLTAAVFSVGTNEELKD